jgi:hypothetical protein
MRFIICGVLSFLASLSALAQDAQAKDAWTALQKDFSRLSNIDVKFTTTQVGASGNTQAKFDNELKVRGDQFWFNQIFPTPSGTQARTIAYDGKVYQSVGDAGYCIKESKPNLTNINTLGLTPMVSIFDFIRPKDLHDTNAFTFLRDPKTWETFYGGVTNAGSETVEGVNLLKMNVKSSEGNYLVKLRPDMNYFPTSWQVVNSVGFPVTVQCSSFKIFPLIDGTISFPTKITEVLAKPDGAMVVCKTTEVESIVPLTKAKADNSDFQIDTSLMGIFDEDHKRFVK